MPPAVCPPYGATLWSFKTPFSNGFENTQSAVGFAARAICKSFPSWYTSGFKTSGSVAPGLSLV